MEITPSLYQLLERRARFVLRRQGLGDAPETMSLVNRACVKMARQDSAPNFESRAEYLAYSAKVMRSVLANLARDRCAAKRGGGPTPAPLDEEVADGAVGAERILDVHRKLEELAKVDPERVKLVELRFFAGCTWEECSEALGRSVDTLRGEWAFVKSWLQRELRKDET